MGGVTSTSKVGLPTEEAFYTVSLSFPFLPVAKSVFAWKRFRVAALGLLSSAKLFFSPKAATAWMCVGWWATRRAPEACDEANGPYLQAYVGIRDFVDRRIGRRCSRGNVSRLRRRAFRRPRRSFLVRKTPSPRCAGLCATRRAPALRRNGWPISSSIGVRDVVGSRIAPPSAVYEVAHTFLKIWATRFVASLERGKLRTNLHIQAVAAFGLTIEELRRRQKSSAPPFGKHFRAKYPPCERKGSSKAHRTALGLANKLSTTVRLLLMLHILECIPKVGTVGVVGFHLEGPPQGKPHFKPVSEKGFPRPTEAFIAIHCGVSADPAPNGLRQPRQAEEEKLLVHRLPAVVRGKCLVSLSH